MSDKTLREAAEALVDKLDTVDGELAAITMLAYVHGRRYDGPNYSEDLKALRAALANSADAPEVEPLTETEWKAILDAMLLTEEQCSLVSDAHFSAKDKVRAAIPYPTARGIFDRTTADAPEGPMEKALELLQALYLTATYHSGVKKNLKRAISSVQNAIRCERG